MTDDERPKRTDTIRVRVTPAGKAEAKRLARLAGHPDPSAYIRALLARESERHPAPKD
jgi:hypothetical protein